MNFEQNCYNPCVYNRLDEGEKTTVRVHVDDLKISSVSKLRLLEVIRQLKEVYGEITEHLGVEHDYLGMVLSYHPEERQITLNMGEYIQVSIEEFEKDTLTKIKMFLTPATNNLFHIRNGPERNMLGHIQKSQFYSTVVKLLFVAKHGRPDILLAVSFLTTKVQEPDMDDWKKLIRVLGYLKGTVDFELVKSCKNLDTLTWYIYVTYAVHHDMKGKSGALLRIGESMVFSPSNKQKLITRSSTETETELIAVDDALLMIQWTREYMKDQGYDLETIIKEDNKSSMILMKNRRVLSGKRTKHLDICYFYVKDLLERGIVKIEHCCAEDMIADFFTKPLQGRKFKIMRDLILNRSHSLPNNTGVCWETVINDY